MVIIMTKVEQPKYGIEKYILHIQEYNDGMALKILKKASSCVI